MTEFEYHVLRLLLIIAKKEKNFNDLTYMTHLKKRLEIEESL